MTVVEQPSVALCRAAFARPANLSNWKNSAVVEMVTIPHYRIVNHFRVILNATGIPQEFTLTATYAGQRICELFPKFWVCGIRLLPFRKRPRRKPHLFDGGCVGAF